MGGKTNKTTTTQTTTPPADVLAQYQSLIQRAQGVSGGPTTAGPTALQGQAWNAFGAIPGQYEGNALDAAGRAGAPIDAAGIARYENPYQKDVIDATMANLRETNAQQANQVKGNAIAQGALGGSREAVAQAELAREQGLANGQTLAGLNAANYSQAVSAAQADRDAAARAAGLYGGLEANAAGIAGAQLGAGTQQQQLNQALLTQPYQQAGWLAQILGSVGPQEGSTTTGVQETPAPSLLQQIAGLGIAGLGLAGGLGWKPFASAATGAIPGLYAQGGGIGRASGGKTTSRVHEMMQTALDLADKLKQAQGGAVPNMGIATHGFADGGEAFPSWMFDPPSEPPVELLERGTGRVIGSGISAPTLDAPPQTKLNVDRIPLSPPVTASVTPQTGVTRGIAAPPIVGDTGDGGPVDVTGLGEPVQGAPMNYASMAAGDNTPIMLDKVTVRGTGRGGPGGIADSAVPYDTSGTSPAVTAGIAQKAASQGAPEWSLPLIAAGLGILASRSPNLGVALGEGGLQGVNQLMAQRKQAADQAQSDREYDLRAQALRDQIATHQYEMNKPIPLGVNGAYDPVTKTIINDTPGVRDAPTGYRWKPNGDLEKIPGGPAEGGKTRPLPQQALNNLGAAGESFINVGRVASTFKDEYGGHPFAGDLENWIGRTFGGGNAEQAQWWQDYQAQKNVVRNKLFGAALTAQEKSEFEKSDINPGMSPDAIKANLARQQAAATRAASKLAKAQTAQGYDAQLVADAMGVTLDDLEAAGGVGAGRNPPANSTVPKSTPRSGATTASAAPAPNMGPSGKPLPADEQAKVDTLRQRGIPEETIQAALKADGF